MYKNRSKINGNPKYRPSGNYLSLAGYLKIRTKHRSAIGHRGVHLTNHEVPDGSVKYSVLVIAVYAMLHKVLTCLWNLQTEHVGAERWLTGKKH